MEKKYYSWKDELSSYEKETSLYSETHRTTMENVRVLDRALEYCVLDNRNIILNKDILLATLDIYERTLDEDDGCWTDKKLNTDYATLCHVYGRYRKELWLKFHEIREYFSTESIAEKTIVA